jgi:phosphoesterase RecJ-like protein
MVKNASATNNDIEGFSDFVRTIKGVEVAIMIYEQNVQSCRINFRSKGKFKVNGIANELGGGGHAFAAGAMLEGSLSDLTTKIVSLSKQMIIQQVKEQT